jgi:hypothetical protein
MVEVPEVGDGDGKKSLGRDWLQPALVTGAFGLLGVLAGGLISYKVQDRQITSQQDLAVTQDRAVARGTARLMSVEFRVDVNAINAALRPGTYPARHINIDSALSVQDERVVASAMSESSWASVSHASAVVGRASRMLDRHPGHPLVSKDLKSARTYRKVFGQAITALNDFDVDLR